MSVIRHCHGEPQPVQAPVADSKQVDVGDICGVATDGTLVKASDETFATDAATTRANFAAKFLGVSAQYKAANAPVYGNQGSGTIRVDTGGSYRAPLKTGVTVKIGDKVGPSFNSTTSKLNDDELDLAAAGGAIGKVTGLPMGGTGPEIMVDLFSVKGGDRDLTI